MELVIAFVLGMVVCAVAMANYNKRIGKEIVKADPNADLLPKGWKTASSNPRKFSEQDFANGIDFVLVTESRTSIIATEQMRAKAEGMEANYGVELVRYLIKNMDKIPASLQENNWIVIPEFLVESPGGALYIAYLIWDGNRWSLNFGRVGNGCYADGRFVRPA